MPPEQPIRTLERDGPLPASECAQGSSEGSSGVPELNGKFSFSNDPKFAEQALHTLPSGFVVVSNDGTLLYVNEAFASLCGRENQLIGTKFAELLSRGSAIFYETHFAPSLYLRGALNEIALELLRPDGTQHPIFVNAAHRPAADGNPSQLHLTVFSAKQRKQYEAELLRAKREFEEVAEIVRRSADGILRLDSEARIASWNKGAQQIFGYTADEATGKSFKFLFSRESWDNVADALARLREGKDDYREGIGLHQSGKALNVSVSLSPHMEAPGTLIGASAVIRDLTAQKRVEKALLQSEKLASVGRLASSIAHEINNPLESVTNLLFILASRVEDEETKQFVVTAQEELARVSHIATHTLRFHKQSTNQTEVNLEGLLGSVLALYRARLENSHISTKVDCPGDPRLICYEGELRQVLVNLVANAYDAMRLGGKLLLRAQASREWKSNAAGIRILVADSGMGMEPDTLAHIFEPFFSTKGIGGTGLGLWISRDLVMKNGGTITARSTTRPGSSGTVFSLFFPYSKS
jgi:PAS domain S-box-containing protein